jgi:hypothetical protein
MQNKLPPSTVAVHADTPSQREICLSKLRVASTGAKLRVSVLEDLQILLRQRAISVAEIQALLSKEGLAI